MATKEFKMPHFTIPADVKRRPPVTQDYLRVVLATKDGMASVARGERGDVSAEFWAARRKAWVQAVKDLRHLADFLENNVKGLPKNW